LPFEGEFEAKGEGKVQEEGNVKTFERM